LQYRPWAQRELSLAKCAGAHLAQQSLGDFHGLMYHGILVPR